MPVPGHSAQVLPLELVPVPGHSAQVLPLEQVPVPGHSAQVLPLELVAVPRHGAQISGRAPTKGYVQTGACAQCHSIQMNKIGKRGCEAFTQFEIFFMSALVHDAHTIFFVLANFQIDLLGNQ